ncbi:MAG: hypothetical protein HQL94_00710, partial [Magnetococcales bacterium]|nr:hypothetical protein [Magnetococcales bacterium]
FVWQRLFFLPSKQMFEWMRSNSANLQGQMQKLLEEKNGLLGIEVEDVNAINRKKIDALENQIKQMNSRLGQEADALIPPDKMVSAMRSLIDKRPDIRLLELNATSVEPVNPESGKTSPKKVEPGNDSLLFYRHNFIMSVEARYLDLLGMLQAIEKLPWVIFWERVEYNASGYPKVVTSIHFFTLTLGEGLFGG